jgi:HAD superfamily hydrolase (TIGR01509 family)
LSIKNALNKIKLHHYFDKIICAEDVQYSKPNPEGFNKALDIFEVNPENALIFEDSSSGFQAAIEAQINHVDVHSLTWLDLCKKYT